MDAWNAKAPSQQKGRWRGKRRKGTVEASRTGQLHQWLPYRWRCRYTVRRSATNEQALPPSPSSHAAEPQAQRHGIVRSARQLGAAMHSGKVNYFVDDVTVLCSGTICNAERLFKNVCSMKMMNVLAFLRNRCVRRSGYSYGTLCVAGRLLLAGRAHIAASQSRCKRALAARDEGNWFTFFQKSRTL